MRKKIVLLIGSGIVLVSTVLNAQQVSIEVLNRFNPSVISRVYAVSSKLSISPENQLLLAEAYLSQDSLVSLTLKTVNSATNLKDLPTNPLVCHYNLLIEEKKLQEKSAEFINSKINFLQQIKPLSDEQKQDIYAAFMLKCKSPDCSYGDVLKQTLPKFLKDTIYYANLYKAEIRQKTLDATNAYPLKNDKPMAMLKDCRNIVYKYQQALITIDYAYPGANKEKISIVEGTNLYYQPRIDSMLTRTGYFSPVTMFTYAIRRKQILKLTDVQVEQLNADAAELEKIKKEYALKNPDDVYNSADFSRQHMMNILTEDQYKTFLQLRLQKKTEQICADTWKQMKQYGLSTNSDSISTTRSIYFYNLNKLVTSDIYKDKPEVKASLLKDIDVFKPESIKQLEQARKKAAKNTTPNSATKSDTNASFVW